MEPTPKRRLHYSELVVWQKACAFSSMVSEIVSDFNLPGQARHRDQLNRSALSVPSNIAEGEGQSTNRNSIRYYFIARGSLNEARTQLADCFMRGWITQDKLKEVDQLAGDVARLIAGVLRARRAREQTNPKKK